MINFWKNRGKENTTAMEDAERSLEASRISLQKAASGTRTAAMDLISDLKNAIENREKKYQILVENIQDGMYILRDKKFIFVNRALCEMIGLPRHEIVGKTLKEIVDIKEHYVDMMPGDESGHREYTVKYNVKNSNVHKIVTVWETLSSDKEFAIEMGFTEEESMHDCVVAIGTVKDVTSSINKERMLRAFSSVINDSSDVIMVVSYPGNIMFVNDAFETMYGYTNEEVAGQNPNILKSNIHSKSFYTKMWDTLLCGQEWRGTIFNRAKDGSIIEDETKIIPFNNGNETPLFFMAIKRVRKILTDEEVVELRSRHAKLKTDFDTAHIGL